MTEDFHPVIGKTVIETLTSGMYDDARFVFREYVQNAADQIDVAFENNILSKKSEGKVEIIIDQPGRLIIVEDNATGIPSDQVLRFLGDVANSQKDKDKRKGFRGIGRLGGLGYCDKLVFETSAYGEPIKSIMSLDAKQLKYMIEDTSVNLDASAVISVVTSIERESEVADRHYFRIKLINVTSAKLLDESSVSDYLSMVAPVPFHKDFTFQNDIKKHLTINNILLDEYNVFINKKQLFKAYRDEFVDDGLASKWLAVDFFDVRDDNSELLAIGWLGFRERSNFVLSTNNNQKGIRLRKSNIGLGDENTISRFFKAPRTNHRFIGELHAVNNNFIPNARRDYFNENKTLQVFEEKLEDLFKEKNLENRFGHVASDLHRRLEEIENYKRAQSELKEKTGKFTSQTEEEQFVANLKVAEIIAQKAVATISKIGARAENDTGIKTLYKHITAGKDMVISTSKDVTVNQYDPPKFTKLKGNEEAIVLTIIDIIDKTLKPAQAKILKEKIIDQFNS